MGGMKTLPVAVKPFGTVGVMSAAVATTRTECGVGALAVWADKLWWTTYPAENLQGSGLGIWSMGVDGVPELVLEHNECHTGRMIYGQYLHLGRYRISTAGTITQISGFAYNDRICGWTKTQQTGRVFALTMEGKVYRYDNNTNAVTQIADADTGMGITSGGGDPHFKSIAALGTGLAGTEVLICVSNGSNGDGRVGRYFVESDTWTTDNATGSWVEAFTAGFGGEHGWAMGHDHSSPLLALYPKAGTAPRMFRLPWGSVQWAQMYQQEWMRIRDIETERYHAYHHGLFYELSPCLGTNGSDVAATGWPKIQPMARYSRTITDMTVFNGALVLGGNHLSTHGGAFPSGGQPSASLLFTTLDAIWGWGRPTGFGYLAKGKAFSAGETSDAMLAKGFLHKCIQITNAGASAVDVKIVGYLDRLDAAPDTIELDTVTIPAAGGGVWTAPAGYACDWLAIKSVGIASSLTVRVDYA